MPLIKSRDIPHLALDFMNADHQQGATLINQLNAMLGSASPAEISASLDRLAAHTREHFAREEAEMQTYGFPPYPIHRLEHERVLNEMTLEIERWNSRQDTETLAVYLGRALPDWFIRHISTMDNVTAEFIHQKASEQGDQRD